MISGSSGWAFKVAATIDTRSDRLVSCLLELKLTESGPKLVEKLIFYYLFCMIMLVKYVEQTWVISTPVCY